MSILDGGQPKGVRADSQRDSLNQFRLPGIGLPGKPEASSPDFAKEAEANREIVLAQVSGKTGAQRQKPAEDPAFDSVREGELTARWAKLHSAPQVKELPGKFSTGGSMPIEVSNNGDGTCTAKGYFPEQPRNVGDTADIVIKGRVVKTEKGLQYVFDHGRTISQNNDGSIITLNPAYDRTIGGDKYHRDSSTCTVYANGLVIDEGRIILPNGERILLANMRKTTLPDGSTEYSLDEGWRKTTVSTTGKVTIGHREKYLGTTTWNADGSASHTGTYEVAFRDKLEKTGASRSYTSPDGSLRVEIGKDETGKDRYVVTTGNTVRTVDENFNLVAQSNNGKPIKVAQTSNEMYLDGGSLEMRYADGTGINTDKGNFIRAQDGRSAHVHLTVPKPDGKGRQEIWFSLDPNDQTVYFSETSSSRHPSVGASLPKRFDH